MVKLWVRLAVAYTPLAPSTPSRCPVKVTCSERSTSARLVIGWLKVSMIGMPTP